MMRDMTIDAWMEELYSKKSVPGGGGASALAGAMGAALDGMVANLTTGKKKYAQYQEDIEKILEKSAVLKDRFLTLMDEDAQAFEPLSRAYSLPKSTPEELAHRDEVMEAALDAASIVPIKIMMCGVETVDLCEELAQKGSKIALSDVGVSLMMLRSAITGASLNVFINTKMMKNLERKEAYESKVNELLEENIARIDTLYERVLGELKG